MGRALEAADYASARDASHSLKGMCGAIGALRMSTLSAAIEDGVRTGSDGNQQLLRQLNTEFVNVIAALQVFMPGAAHFAGTR
ncbi:MAG TPA: Hpt domain-containing protein [Vicinamibacterales bacterium]|nr:Hpt domain-containing protein [Vicinamibacterales bacterium]